MAVKLAQCDKRLKPTLKALWHVCGAGIPLGARDGRNIRLTWQEKLCKRKESKMSESSSVPPILNKTIKFMLRSPLHGIVSSYLALITFPGCKSGKSYTTPVSYYQKDNQVIIFTHANWWKNLCGGVPVQLRMKGKNRQGVAEPIVEDKTAIASELTAHLMQSPFEAKFYNVTFDDQNQPIPSDVDDAVKTVAMIRVQLD